MSGQTRGLPPRLALFFACLPLFGWWMTGLFDVDEGFYGAVVAEMNRRHEWITPFFNGQPWFEKPILVYWLAKPCMMLFGPNFGPRLPSVLCTFGLFLVCGFFMKRRYGATAQSLAIFCLGSSILVLALGRLMMTDAPLNLALTTAFLSFYESLVGDRRWRILSAFCIGLGVLAKGPVAIILFILVAGIFLWRNPSQRGQVKGYWLVGTAVLFATIATWYLPCYLANGQVFVQKFLIEQNVGRFLGGDKAHSLGLAGLPFYIPFVLIAVCPWGWVEWRAFTKENLDDPFSSFLFIWAVAIFTFFTISSAKLPHYILPMIPPMAMLAAKRISTKPRLNWTGVGVACTSLILLLGVIDPILRIWYKASGQQEAQSLARRHPEIEVLYQLGRREKELNTGTPKLQETDLPSLIMYLNHDVIETDEEIRLGDPIPVRGDSVIDLYDPASKENLLSSKVFFTRKSRISTLQHKVDVIEEGENFGVYKLRIGP
jgi:4-amino-4-deoxy-L-arabinose transferase-like glycosyltransferase